MEVIQRQIQLNGICVTWLCLTAGLWGPEHSHIFCHDISQGVLWLANSTHLKHSVQLATTSDVLCEIILNVHL